MILVRIVFHGELGHASQMVAGMKAMEDAMRGANVKAPRHTRIMTDLSGQFDTVVQELVYDSMEEFMASQTAMFADPKWQELMQKSGWTDHVRDGSKEFFTIEYEG